MMQYSTEFLSIYSPDTPVEVIWTAFKTKCHECLELIPQTVSSKNHFKAPWINARIKRLSNRKKRAYNRARYTQIGQNITILKNCHNKNVAKLIISMYTNLSVLSNHKRLWSYIKSKRQENIGISTLKDDKGTYKHSIDKANVLNKYFSTVFTKENIDDLLALDSPPYPLIDDLNVTTSGIVLLLQDLEVHKACGPDGIFLKKPL